MPRSKRQQVLSLTQATKKSKDSKGILFNDIRQLSDTFEYIYLFKVSNMRNVILQDIRKELKPGRLILGKNKIISKSLGLTIESEYKPGISSISKLLNGNVGLIFTNLDPASLNENLSQFIKPDFARTGSTATETVILKQGPLIRFTYPRNCSGNSNDTNNNNTITELPKEIIFEQSEYFPHSMEPQLRKLGLPTTLVKGVVTMFKEHVVCKEGDVLTPEQTQILKHLNLMQSEFKIIPQSYYKSMANDSDDYIFETIQSI